MVVLCVFLLFVSTAAFYNIPEPEYLNTTFGWEYGNIAEALVNGRGYSDAFGFGSGPTAWMPPLYVFFLAGAFTLFGVKTVTAMWAIFIVKYVALAASLYFLLSIANKTTFKKYKYGLAFLFIVLIYVNRDAYFKGLHDDWLILFLACLMLWTFTNYILENTKVNNIVLGALAFLLPLASPALSAAFLFTWTGILFFRQRAVSSTTSRWRVYLAILFLFGASTLLWTHRNYQAFGTFIPLKSNFWFDFYQANYLDEDGLLTNSTFAIFHPIARNGIQAEYFTEKEAQFIENYKRLSFEQLRTNPSPLLKNIAGRAFSAFVFVHYSEDLLPVLGDVFLAPDIQKLSEARLISTHELPTVYWTSLTLSEDEFKRRIAPFHLKDEAIILQDWREQKDLLVSRRRDWKSVSKSLLLSLVPFLCIVGGLFVRRFRKDPVFMVTISIYLTYLSPYVLTAYYRRYQAPMIGLHSILIFFVICLILDRLLTKRTTAPKP
jgi:hypothetical protein